MTKFEAVDDIRRAMLELILAQENIADNDEDVSQVFRNYYLRLLERFYKENNDIMAYPQYEAAKSDPKYFMRFILWAYCIYRDEVRNATLH